MSTSTLLVVVLSAVTCLLALVSAGTPSPAPHTIQEAAHRLEMILNNTRSRENYIRCFMDRGICNKDALSIKRILTEALTTNCTNCTETQRLGAERFFQYLQDRQPETWSSLTAKYGGPKDKDDDDDESDDDDDDDKKKTQGAVEANSHGPPGTAATNENKTGNSSTISIIF